MYLRREGVEIWHLLSDTFTRLHSLFICKVLEEWPAQTSYDVGLEAEKAALEKQETKNMHEEQVPARSIWKTLTSVIRMSKATTSYKYPAWNIVPNFF